MIYVVTSNNRHKFAPLLDAMHRDRKRIFVDRLKWGVPVVDGVYEIDQFDTDNAIYLVASDADAKKHLGSVRVLPSKGEHLLGSLFPYLCENGVPVGEEISEITRLCTSPDLPRESAIRVRALLATGLFEFGLLYGIKQFTGVAQVEWLSQVLSAGWDCKPLGPPQDVDGEMIGAIIIHVHSETLQNFRSFLRLRGPVLHLESVADAA